MCALFSNESAINELNVLIIYKHHHFSSYVTGDYSTVLLP